LRNSNCLGRGSAAFDTEAKTVGHLISKILHSFAMITVLQSTEEYSSSLPQSQFETNMGNWRICFDRLLHRCKGSVSNILCHLLFIELALTTCLVTNEVRHLIFLTQKLLVFWMFSQPCTVLLSNSLNSIMSWRICTVTSSTFRNFTAALRRL